MSDLSIASGEADRAVLRRLEAPLTRRRSPGLWIAVERIVRHGVWLLIFVALAPILGPRDYGLVALAMSGIAVLDTALCEIVGEAIGGLPTVEEAHLSTAFIANTAVGAALSLLLYLLASRAAIMLDRPAIGDIFRSLSWLPVLSALTAVPLAVLRRRACFLPVAAAALLGGAVGGGAGIALAEVGCGAWSLVAVIVAQRFVEIAILWACTGPMIGLCWSRRHLRDLAGALSAAALVPVASSLARQLPRLLIALLLGPIAAGLYLLAARFVEALSDIFLAPLAPIVRTGPRASREEPSAVARRLSPALYRASLVAIAAVVGSLGLVESAVLNAVDLRWWGAVKPAQILVLAAIPMVIQEARTASLIGAGRAGREAGWQLGRTLTMALAIAVAAPYGLAAVAAALLAHAIVVGIASLWPMRRVLGAHFGESFRGLVAPFAIAAGIGIALIAAHRLLGASLPPLLVPALLIGLAAASWSTVIRRPAVAAASASRPRG